MKKYTSKNFNVERLLTLGDLDIRGVAAVNEALPADEYFAKVEELLEQAPQYAEALESAADPEKLDDLRGSLEKIGHKELLADIDGICGALSNQQQALADKWAAELSGKLNAFLDRTKSAYTKKKPRANKAPANAENPDSEVLLSEALEYFDYEEAHRKLRILAVDDVTVVLNSLIAALSSHYEVFALTKPSQVKDFLLVNTPELFLLDIEMPEMSGYDLVNIIRQHEKHKETPIIFLTGNASLENLKTAVALGACDFITKPINPEVLLEKIGSKITWKKAF